MSAQNLHKLTVSKSPPIPGPGTLQSAARDSHPLRSDAGRMPRVDAARMAQAATKIQAHFRGQRDRAIVEMKKAQKEFRAKSKAERDLLLAMVKQSSLEGLTDVEAMTKVSQHVRRVPRLGGLNSCFTPATLRLRPVSLVCTGA